MLLTVLNWLTLCWAALLLSSIVSMMAVFLGSSGQYLEGLLGLQDFMLPFGLLAIIAYLIYAGRHDPAVSAPLQVWRHTPGWLVFVVLSAASLALIAELAMVLVTIHGEAPQPWTQRVPAASAAVNALALVTGFASLKLAGGT